MNGFTGRSKLFVNPLVPFFQDREPGLLRIRHRQWFRDAGCVHLRYDLPHRILANQTLSQRLPVHRPAQLEPAPTDSARSLGIVRGGGSVFVDWHWGNAGAGGFRPALGSNGISTAETSWITNWIL